MISVPREIAADAAVRFLPPPCSVEVHEQLVSYNDANFHVVSQSGTTEQQQQQTPNHYVLKVYPAAASQDLELIAAQHAAMAHVAAQGLRTNVPVEAVAEARATVVTINLPGSPALHAVQLLHWVPGEVMGKGPQCRRLQRSLGRLLGRLTVALERFSHPGVPSQGPWCMNSAAATIKHRVDQLTALGTRRRQQLVAAADHLQQLSAALGPLPCQVCHADANEANLLVNDDRTEVTGIIDWGDVCVCWRAAEVAIAMTYVMLLVPDQAHEPDAAARAAGHVLGGYLDERALDAGELEMVPALVEARTALSLANGLYAARDNPGNAGYLLDTQAKGWWLLEWLQAHRQHRWARPRPAGERG